MVKRVRSQRYIESFETTDYYQYVSLGGDEANVLACSNFMTRLALEDSGIIRSSLRVRHDRALFVHYLYSIMNNSC